MPKSERTPTPQPRPKPGARSYPDRRLASMFTKRSSSAPVNAMRIGFVGSYGPTISAAANFTGSLRTALMRDRPGVEVGVVRVTGQGAPPSADIAYELSTSDDEFRCKAAASVLNEFDIALIHYDPRSFGGKDGEQAHTILNWIRIPTVVVVHRMPPPGGGRNVLQALAESADAVVAMSETARQRLIAYAGVPPRKTVVIPHGAHVGAPSPLRALTGRRPNILTWGLLAPGMGVEWAIEAMGELSRRRPLPRYLVVGPTESREFAMDGDRYRNMLASRASSLGLTSIVEFGKDYLVHDRLQELLHEADVVVIPYDSHEQEISAVLVEAIAARKPVVATRFAHAVELLDGEHGGLLVEHENPGQIAGAVARILSDQALAEHLVTKASGLADALSWSMAAAQYRQLFDALLRRPGTPA